MKATVNLEEGKEVAGCSAQKHKIIYQCLKKNGTILTTMGGSGKGEGRNGSLKCVMTEQALHSVHIQVN